MLCFLNHCQDIIVRGYIKFKSSLLPFKEINMGSNDLPMNSKDDNRSNINFPLHHALDQVDLNTDLIDKLISINILTIIYYAGCRETVKIN